MSGPADIERVVAALRPGVGSAPKPRPHQQEAIAAAVRALAVGDRAQLALACGSGKTLVGRWLAEQLGAAITLVVVPSLPLVAQTLQEWRSVTDLHFEAFITCSDPTTAAGAAEREAGDGQDVAAPYWARHRARVTTSAGAVASVLENRLRAWPLVIFSTYHSAHVVAEAARSVNVPIDLVIADEAHRLAGQSRRDFRVVLDERLPARKRVFMTATRVVTAAAEGEVVWSEPVSMDDEALFGPVAYRLDFADAIARGLLVDYRVLVYETPGDTAPDPAAALVTAAAHGVSSVLSFHGRIAKARAFADAVDGIRLPDGRIVVARSVAGADPTEQREQALALLADVADDELVVVASARCLNEGIDVPGVDGVLFADPKHSDVDVVQAVGRALRRRQGKQAGLVLLPVTVPAGVDDDSVLSTNRFAAVWRILRGLRAMDDRLAAQLDRIARQPSRRGRRDGSHTISNIVFEVPSLAESQLVARLVDCTSPAWDRTYAELAVYARQHGEANPASSTSLGSWCGRQRRAHRAGMLLADRAAQLQRLPGWWWDIDDRRWHERYSEIQAFVDRTGRRLDVDDPDVATTQMQYRDTRTRTRTVGRWCAWQRILARRDELDTRRRAALDRIPGWRWQAVPSADAAAVDLLAEYVAWKRDANPPADYVDDGVRVGAWLNDIRRRRVTGRLPQAILDEVEVVTPSMSGALNWHYEPTMWLLGLEALRQFVSREGHCRIPSLHIEPLTDIDIGLAQWCTRQRAFRRQGRMVAARARMLEQVAGWRWEIAAAPRIAQDIGNARHGTRTGYVKGCRCQPCTNANTVGQQRRIADRARGESTSAQIGAGRSRAHLKVLVAQGAQFKPLAKVCGLDRKTLRRLYSGEQQRILPTAEQAIMQVTIDQVRAAAAPGALVDAAPTRRLLDGMVARGWPKSWIARELGLQGRNLPIARDRVTAATAAKFAELDQRLGMLPAPPIPRGQAIPTLDELIDLIERCA